MGFVRRASFAAVTARRLVIAGIIGTSSLLIHGAPAGATVALRHASLTRSEPAADSVMPAGQTTFRLVFSEPISPDLSGAALVAASGDTIKLVTTGDPRDVHALVAPVPPLEPGSYRMAWRIVSADGHPVKGNFKFRVAERVSVDTARPPPAPPPAPPPEAPAPGVSDDAAAGPTLAGAPIIPAILRGLGVGALMGLAGLLAFTSWLAPTADTRHRRLATALAIAAPVFLTAHLIAWLINISPDHALDATTASATLGTAIGRVEAVRVVLAWLALWALALARREHLALWLAAGALVVSGAIGHPAAITPLIAIPSKVVHLAGAALWLGGLLWLTGSDRNSPPTFLASAHRVSSIALASIITVALSGLIQTVLFLPDFADIYRSAYGIGVLAKVAGLAVLVAFGAHHRYRVMPSITSSADCVRMSHSVGREVATMVIVTLIGGILAYIPPPARPTDAHTSSLESDR